MIYAVINFASRRVYVETKTVHEAGWLGFGFAQSYPMLTTAGWWLNYYEDRSKFPSPIPKEARAVHDVAGPSTLAREIHAGPPERCCHDCCCHKE